MGSRVKVVYYCKGGALQINKVFKKNPRKGYRDVPQITHQKMPDAGIRKALYMGAVYI